MAANTQMYWKDKYFSDAGKEMCIGGDCGGVHKFCESLAETMNTTGKVKCKTEDFEKGSSSSYDEPNFVTSDGVRFWGLEGYKWDKEDGQAREIFVDRTIGTNELKAVAKARDITDEEKAKGLKIRVWYDGKIDTGNTEDYDYVNDLIENSLQVTNKKD